MDSETFNTVYSAVFWDSSDLRSRIETFKQFCNSELAIKAGAWCPDKISQEALVCLASNHLDGSKLHQGLRRGHVNDRLTRVKKTFSNGNQPVPDAFSYYFQYEETAIITIDENKISGTTHWSELHQIDRGLCNSKCGGWTLRKRHPGFPALIELALDAYTKHCDSFNP